MKTIAKSRRLSLSDGGNVKEMSSNHSDLAIRSFRRHYLVDPFDCFEMLHDNYEGIILERQSSGKVMGSGLIRYEKLQFEGKIRAAAQLNHLIVPLRFRWQNAHKLLIHSLMDRFENQLGENGLLYTYFLPGSKRALNSHWYTQIIENKVIQFLAQMNKEQPKIPNGWTLGPIKPEETNQVIDLVNDFHKEYNFYVARTPQDFNQWLSKTLDDNHINQYWLIRDSNQNVLAGIGISELFRLRKMHLQGKPFQKSLNFLLNFMPANGDIKELGVSMFWYLPGQEEAAKLLWDSIRYDWRQFANTVLLQLDPDSPISQIIESDLWPQKTALNIAVRSTKPIDIQRLFYAEPF